MTGKQRSQSEFRSYRDCEPGRACGYAHHSAPLFELLVVGVRRVANVRRGPLISGFVAVPDRYKFRHIGFLSYDDGRPIVPGAIVRSETQIVCSRLAIRPVPRS